MRAPAVCVVVLLFAALGASPTAAGCICQTKINAPDGALVQVTGIESVVFGGCFYLEDRDKAAGIKVVGGPVGLPWGLRAIEGIISTGPNWERQIIYGRDLPHVETTDWVAPLELCTCQVGGGNYAYNARTGKGQRGIYGRYGPNNIGLYVVIQGKVTAVCPQQRFFYVEGRCQRRDGTGFKGIRVDYGGGYVVKAPRLGQCATIDGISSAFVYQGKMQSMILWPGEVRPCLGGPSSRTPRAL